MSIISHKKVPIQLHNDVIAYLRKHISIANLFFNTTFNEPQIQYRKKGSVAGSAFLEKWQIQININMLLEHKFEFITEVIPHELAHLITYQQYGRVKPHGEEWQYVMEHVFQCTPKRTHSFTLPDTLQQKRYRYICQCQEHFLTVIRHNRIEQRKTQYYCKRCGMLLQIDKNHSTC